MNNTSEELPKFGPVAGTVLLVDDNPANLGILTDYLKTYNLKVPVATSGETALKRAKLIQPDLILLDVVMHGIDGFETCLRLKADEATRDIPVIFMTALTDHDSKVRGLSCGAVDYVTKPIHQEEVLMRIQTHLKLSTLTSSLKTRSNELANANAQLAKANRRILQLNDQLQEENIRMNVEMKLARRIQTALLPERVDHDELDITAVMLPAKVVGGDYYDFTFDRAGNLWFAIGDVSGHGITAGLIMMMVETAFNVCIKDFPDPSPKDIVVIINHILKENVQDRLQEEHFMTLNLLQYKGKGHFIFAGLHVDIIVYRAAEKKCEFITTEGCYLGLIPEVEPSTENRDFTLNKDDILVLYTDGITEARQKGKKMLDSDGLAGIIEQNAHKSVDEIKDTVLEQTLEWYGEKQKDDITMIIARKK